MCRPISSNKNYVKNCNFKNWQKILFLYSITVLWRCCRVLGTHIALLFFVSLSNIFPFINLCKVAAGSWGKRLNHKNENIILVFVEKFSCNLIVTSLPSKWYFYIFSIQTMHTCDLLYFLTIGLVVKLKIYLPQSVFEWHFTYSYIR